MMIITTTDSVSNKVVSEYTGIVFGEVMTQIKNINTGSSGFSDFFNKEDVSYESDLISSRINALKELEERAIELKADAVLGLTLDYQVLGPNKNILLVSVSGTAVKFE